MRFTIYGKNMHVTDDLKDLLKKKLSKFDRYFSEDTNVYATFRKEKKYQSLEVTIPLGSTVLRAEVREHKLPVAIDKVVDKLQGQLRKHKTKLQRYHGDEFKKSHHRIDLIEAEAEEYDEDEEVVRVKKVLVKPMSPEEAALQMDLLGHTFFVFLNADSNDIDVVYKREDGNYGLIEPYI